MRRALWVTRLPRLPLAPLVGTKLAWTGAEMTGPPLWWPKALGCPGRGWWGLMYGGVLRCW